MPTQQFEGKSLDEVLRRVTEELGESAEIIEAQKHRKGGIAGFFAQEWYEVTARRSTAELQENAARESAAETMTSVMDLAEAVNQREKSVDLRSPVSELVAGSARVDSADQSFAQVLREVSDDMIVGSDDVQVVEDVAPLTDEPRVVEPMADPVEETGQPSGLGSGLLARHAAKQTTEESLPLDVAAAVIAEPSQLPKQLERRGVPASFITKGTDDQVLDYLASKLRRLPQAPTLAATKGSVIVIVGDADRAAHHARSMAAQLRRDPTDVVTFSRDPHQEGTGASVLHSPEDAAAAKRSWKRRTKTTVVVLEADQTQDSMIWSESILAALEPTSTWAVVNAIQKIEDIEYWSEQLGGVEALILENARKTSSPAAILSLGIPVSRLDDERATASLWSSIILDTISG